MKKAELKPDAASAARELFTVRDFVRYAVSCFERSEIYYGHGTFNAYDEAVFLVLEGLRLPIDQLDPFLDARLLPAERKRLAELITARVTTRKPTPYLVNRAYLQGVPFYVDERVIVPRSYIAELLTGDLVDEDGGGLIPAPENVGRVLDLCTGSGCLAILAAHVFAYAEVDAVDLSKDALEVAKINVAETIHADRIHLHRGDLFAPLKGQTYDLIITNPPYVDAEDMTDMPKEYLHEPRMALAAGQDGLDIVRRIIAEAPRHMNPGAGMICEIGHGRPAFDAAYPDLDVLWLDTENSENEVFWVTREQLLAAAKPAKRKKA
jgi:ribosomal protein L3 glutamine methyltransferase